METATQLGNEFGPDNVRLDSIMTELKIDAIPAMSTAIRIVSLSLWRPLRRDCFIFNSLNGNFRRRGRRKLGTSADDRASTARASTLLLLGGIMRKKRRKGSFEKAETTKSKKSAMINAFFMNNLS